VPPSGGNQLTGVLHATSTFILTCTGPGGPASASATVKVLGVFPIRVEKNTRYLVDAEGNPFLLQGDAGWELIAKLSDSDVDLYLEDRRLKGFNAVIVRLIDHDFVPSPPNNNADQSPFTPCNVVTHVCDFSARNDPYFDHAADVINKAAEKGILVLLAPAYTGFLGGDQGWFQEMQANGTSTLQGYGQYLGNRYQNFTNILWVNGGDYSPDNAGKALVRAVANGIRGANPGALHTFHGGRFTAALDFWGPSEPWLTVNDIYTDEDTVVSMAFQEYARPQQMPFFMIENRYENEGADAALVRTQAYQAMLSGATGHVMGNFPMWGFWPGWQAALDSGGASTLKHLRKLFEARAWWTLQPDRNATLLTIGIGSGANRAAAARAGDGSFAIAYVPSLRTVTIDLSQLNGPNVKAQWCDPHDGNCATVPGSPFAATGPQDFPRVSNNNGGFGDWVLVLESTP